MKLKTAQHLRDTLTRIDSRGYKAYKDIRGGYQFERHQLFVDYVQGDPFASPSKIRLRVLLDDACIPPPLHNNTIRRIALQDYIARLIDDTVYDLESAQGSGKSGLMRIDVGCQAVIERSAVLITDTFVEARMEVGLPARGRSVLGHQAIRLLCEQLSIVVEDALDWDGVNDTEAEPFVECIENQAALRSQLAEHDLVAFVANGSILPRKSGASDQPLDVDHAIPFQAPESLSITLKVPNPIQTQSGTSTSITGMGIRTGITLIVGGGYHGKSTLLQALEHAVYFHIPGDGREYVVIDPGAVKIRSEDGRRVEKVDISPFINNLPVARISHQPSTTSSNTGAGKALPSSAKLQGVYPVASAKLRQSLASTQSSNSRNEVGEISGLAQDTQQFSSEDASGSTSQAANIMEAIEVGCPLLLLDEDTSSTNFMIRDARMQALVHKNDEPITSFLDRIRAFYNEHAISTILVMGGCGDYFAVADTVIMMKAFLPIDATDEAHAIINQQHHDRHSETLTALHWNNARVPNPTSIDASKGRHESKVDVKGADRLIFGRNDIELRGLEQLIDPSQTRAIGYALCYMRMLLENNQAPLCELLDQLEARIDEVGIDCLKPYLRDGEHPGNLARPRRFEIASALNRLRTLKVLT